MSRQYLKKKYNLSSYLCKTFSLKYETDMTKIFIYWIKRKNRKLLKFKYMYKILSKFKILIFYYSSRFLRNHPCSKALGRKRAKRRKERFL